MKISKTAFGTTPDGQSASLYRLENTSGFYVDILDYGCRVMSICIPNKNGVPTDVALGLENFDEYLKDDASLGAVVGRVANRIANAHFSLNGKEYSLAKNNGPNHLHGGPTGYGTRIWNAKFPNDKLILSRVSPSGEEGYPGTVTLNVIYSWSEDNELSITYEAKTDEDTILNLTNHTYFNLNGHNSGTILDHELRIDADKITELNDVQIPTGRYIPVEGTPFDFRTFKTIGTDIEKEDSQLKLGGTYDHNFVLNGSGFREAAVLQSKESGIRMTCFTDQPGLQLYSACYTLHQRGKDGATYAPFTSVCLETQHFPNGINIAHFPSIVLKAGDTFKSQTLYHFSIMK